MREAVPAELCVKGREVFEPRLTADGRTVVYGEAEQKVVSLCWHDLAAVEGRQARRITPEPPMRPAWGMGGGTWCFVPTPGAVATDRSDVAYVAADGNLWLLSPLEGTTRQLTDVGEGRSVSGPSCLGRSIAFVVDLAEVWVLDRVTGDMRRVDDGSFGFVIDAALATDTSVEWMAWSAPNMPWDESVRCVANLGDRSISVHRYDGSVRQPRRHPDGRSMVISDATGTAVVWCGNAPVVVDTCEHAGPTWGPGDHNFDPSPDGQQVAFTRNEGGFGRLCIADITTGDVRELGRGVHGQVHWRGDTIVALRTGAVTPLQLVAYDVASGQRTVLDHGSRTTWQRDHLVEPDLVQIAAEAVDGLPPFVHARLYRSPVPGTDRAIVWLHGGPTDQWQVTFMPRLVYWLSRGWHIVVPDHRGSTGHGRAYTQALHGRWGELDVRDTQAALTWVVQHGVAAPRRVVLMGGSAGGFTALCAAAAAPDNVAAVAVAYPVTDLADLPVNSHRFEQHYTDTLVGPWPAANADYERRSPKYWPHRFVGIPLLVMHGDCDPVVPVQQSIEFVSAVRAAGGDAALHIYSGEGHGFRDPANQIDEYRRLDDFLGRHAG